MDAKLKQKWVEALRSGEYRQTRGTLHDGVGYCCLGVLCKVAGLEIDPVYDAIKGQGATDGYQPIYDLIGGRDVSYGCSERNDGACDFPDHSFAQLADYIEVNIPADAGAA